MKRKIIFIILVIINILFFMHTLNAKAIKTNNDEYKIEEKTYDYKILIYYPITKYPTLNKNIKESTIYSDIMGSDHCPVGIEIEI